MSTYPVFVPMGFTILVQMTFICPGSDCIYKLAHFKKPIPTDILITL